MLWALARAFALDTFHPAVSVIAFTPLAAVTAIVPVAVALAAREWVVAAIAAAALAVLAAVVLPRALDGPQHAIGDARGRTLVVMTANLYFGGVDPRSVVRLVREHDVDVLSLQELTPEAVARLDAAGLRDLLPGRVLRARPRAAGTGLLARGALRPVATKPGAELQASLRLAGGQDLRLVAVHPYPPISAAGVHDWQAVLRGLPGPSDDRRAHVLLGDFNATLDHRELRRVLDRGYTDAADATGDGLSPTFPVTWPIRLIAIDHVLVPRTIGVRRVSIGDLPGSDHRAVIAELVLPAG